MKIPEKYQDRIVIGWYEWCSLDDLSIPAIKAKVDTGAATSALHAFDIQPFVKKHKDYVRFRVHPLQANTTVTINCVAPIVDVRSVMSSNGHEEHRFVIETALTLAGQRWDIKLTLSNRDPLRFRMLIGREAMGHHMLIAPDKKRHQGKLTKRYLREIYPDFRSKK